MRTLPFVPIAEAAFIAGLSDRQMSRVVDEHLVPAALLGQHGSARLFARLAAAFARFYFDTEQTLLATARRGVVEELLKRVQGVQMHRDVLSLLALPAELSWKVVRKTIEIDLSPYVEWAFVRAREVDEAETLILADPETMGGMPCFAGTRVPIEIVLGSIDEGMSLTELRASYDFVDDRRVAAARVYATVHPRRGRPRQPGPLWSGGRRREDWVRPSSTCSTSS